MAQPTGSTILTHARLLAQDTSTSSPAVSDANALILMNEVLMRFCGDVESKDKLIAASASGLTFSANTAIVEATDAESATTLQFDSILAAYESDSSSVGTILPPQLTRWSVEQMLDAYQNNYDGTMTGSGASGWQAYAWERVATAYSSDGGAALRVYVWPVLSATRYMTLRVPKLMILSALSDVPDLTRREGHVVARLLAWEMARLHTRDTEFLQQILAPVPSTVLDAYFEAAKSHGWMQSGIRQTGALDG